MIISFKCHVAEARGAAPGQSQGQGEPHGQNKHPISLSTVRRVETGQSTTTKWCVLVLGMLLCFLFKSCVCVCEEEEEEVCVFTAIWPRGFVEESVCKLRKKYRNITLSPKCPGNLKTSTIKRDWYIIFFIFSPLLSPYDGPEVEPSCRSSSGKGWRAEDTGGGRVKSHGFLENLLHSLSNTLANPSNRITSSRRIAWTNLSLHVTVKPVPTSTGLFLKPFTGPQRVATRPVCPPQA